MFYCCVFPLRHCDCVDSTLQGDALVYYCVPVILMSVVCVCGLCVSSGCGAAGLRAARGDAQLVCHCGHLGTVNTHTRARTHQITKTKGNVQPVRSVICKICKKICKIWLYWLLSCIELPKTLQGYFIAWKMFFTIFAWMFTNTLPECLTAGQ